MGSEIAKDTSVNQQTALDSLVPSRITRGNETTRVVFKMSTWGDVKSSK